MQVHADSTGTGLLLSHLDTKADAEVLVSFFRETGAEPALGSISYDGSFYVFVPGLTFEELKECSDSANIELVS